jgi:hypothetical protein
MILTMLAGHKDYLSWEFSFPDRERFVPEGSWGQQETTMNDANNPVMPIDSGVRERPVSIVIPVFNKVEHTQLCTVKLIENTPAKLFGVVFVDNASTDGTGAFLGEV